MVTTPAQIRRAQKTAARLAAIVTELRFDLPAATNTEQELVTGALMVAFEKLINAEGNLRSAARYLTDKRTEDEIQKASAEARAEETREDYLRRYGCAP